MHIYQTNSYLSPSRDVSFISSHYTSVSGLGSPKFSRKQKLYHKQTRKQRDNDGNVFKFLSPRSKINTLTQIQEPNKLQDDANSSNRCSKIQRKTFAYSKVQIASKKNEIASKVQTKINNTVTVQPSQKKINPQEQLVKVNQQLQKLKRQHMEKTTELREKKILFQVKETNFLKRIKQLQKSNLKLETKIINLESIISQKVNSLQAIQTKCKQMQKTIQKLSKQQQIGQTQKVITILQRQNKSIIQQMKDKTKLLKYHEIEISMLKRKLQDTKGLLNQHKKCKEKNEQLTNALSSYQKKLSTISEAHRKLQQKTKKTMEKKKSAQTLFCLSQDQENEEVFVFIQKVSLEDQ